MNIEDLRNICSAMPGATEDIKWGHDLVFSIGGKMFCVAGLDQSPTSASFKVSDDEFEDISNWPGFIPAPYVARYKWVLCQDIDTIEEAKWKHYVMQSYNLVKARLPPKIKKQLGFT